MTFQEMMTQEREEGRKEGREEGRKEGREEGREEGRKEGLKEGLDKGIIGSVAIMREDGKSDQEIVERLVRTYGLSEDEAGKFAAGDVQ